MELFEELRGEPPGSGRTCPERPTASRRRIDEACEWVLRQGLRVGPAARPASGPCGDRTGGASTLTVGPAAKVTSLAWRCSRHPLHRQPAQGASWRSTVEPTAPTEPYDRTLVKVTAGTALCDYVQAHGGTLWVRSTRRSCCHGTLTLLRASTKQPGDADRYAPVGVDLPITVRFNAAHGSPEELVLELRGLARKGPAAFWDGCAWKM